MQPAASRQIFRRLLLPSLVVLLGHLHTSARASDTAIRVGVYIGPGCSARGAANVPTVLAYPGSGLAVTTLSADDIRNASRLGRAHFDVLFFPGGSGSDMAAALGPAGRRNVQTFVAEQGGGYCGVCAGAYLAEQHLNMSAFADEPRPDIDEGVDMLASNNNNKEKLSNERGDGNCTLMVSSVGAAALPGLPVAALEAQLTFYANGPVMRQLDELPANVSSPAVLLLYTSPSVPLEKSYQGPWAGRGAVAVGSNSYGRGRVLVSGPHPETDQLDFPARSGPPSAPGSPHALLLQAYVHAVAPTPTQQSACDTKVY